VKGRRRSRYAGGGALEGLDWERMMAKRGLFERGKKEKRADVFVGDKGHFAIIRRRSKKKN